MCRNNHFYDRVSPLSDVFDLLPDEIRIGRILSHEQLLSQVWGPEYVGEAGYVKRYIWYLRQKIEDDPSNPQYILTERGFGYKLGD